jgi:alkanesulfonate monooxygenase SsuD/methylene tetrahydromethanopterin reductase-like flavin-dependent oxidoreductase (luciferase family)
LWEGSWEDGAQTWTAEKGAYDPSKIHKINFDGIYYQMSGYGQAHPSPQRTPVLFQAGSSESGKAFAGKHAEAIFCGGTNMKTLAKFVKEVRAIAVANGRLATDVNFFPMICPILGRTLEEAQAKHDKWKPNADWEGGLATISSFMNVDFSQYPVDEPFDVDGLTKKSSAIHSLINSVKDVAGGDSGQAWTPRMLGHAFAWCGFGQPYVGTPEMIADVFESYINEADIDGFNVACKNLGLCF